MTAFLSLPMVTYEHIPAPPAGRQTILAYQTAAETAPQIKLRLPEVLERIAICESQGKHFDEYGNVLLGKINSHDVGKFQINALYWNEKAESLGYNIYTEEGNESFALELYNRYGTAPWKWSKKCWNK